jgi:small subunit ribosomal protein S6
MKQYELMVIVDPDIGSDAINKSLDEIKKLITSSKGEVFFEDIWGMRELAYDIKGKSNGYYAVYDFNYEGSLKEMDTTLRLDNTVVRHMITCLPAGYKPKSYANEEEESKEEIKEEKKEMKHERRPESARASQKPEPKKVEKKEGASLEEVDAKLASIIDNPDLNF